jgi:hypothetical protein
MLRERVLYTSTQKFLDEGERIEHTVYMWRRHRYALGYIALAGSAMFVLSILVGIEQWESRFGLALASGAVGAAATTQYRILVSTSKGLVLLKSSRVRQKAVGFVTRLPVDTPIRLTGSNLVITEWTVGNSNYSVMKRFQKPMVAISTS